MKTDIELITPEIATCYLSKNRVNRHISEPRVRAYAYDMMNNAWQLNGEAIRFNKAGDLIDGQHRLSAIIKCGVPVKMLVVRDIDDNITLYDRGRNRYVTDSMLIGGMDSKLANNTHVSMAKLAFSMRNIRTPSDLQIKEFIERHADALLELTKIWRKNSSTNGSLLSVKQAPFLLACLNAFESGVTLQDLIEFSEVYRTGMPTSKNQTAAIVCRNDYLKGDISTSKEAQRIRAERIYEKAICDFVRRYPRTKTYKSITEATYSLSDVKTKN